MGDGTNKYAITCFRILNKIFLKSNKNFLIFQVLRFAIEIQTAELHFMMDKKFYWKQVAGRL